MRIVWAACAVALVLLAGAASAATIELNSGEKLEGVVLEETDTTLVIQHQTFGRLEIPKADIKPPEEDKINPGLFGTPILRGFSRSISAGLSGATGKSEEVAANANMNLSREMERHRMQWVGRFFYTRTDGSVSENQLNTRYLHDFLIPDANWFPFLSANYVYDTQQDWRHRLAGQAGIGYDFVKTDEWELTGRVGGGVATTLTDARDTEPDPGVPGGRRNTGDDPIRTEGNALVALQTLWNYTEGQSLSFNTLYLPDLSDTPEFRSESTAEWKIATGFVEGLGFKLGARFIYDSHEIDDAKRDFRYYANLVYDF